MPNYSFSEEELLQLTELNEQLKLIDHAIKRRVMLIGKNQGYSLEEYNLSYDIEKGHIVATALKKESDAKKTTKKN